MHKDIIIGKIAGQDPLTTKVIRIIKVENNSKQTNKQNKNLQILLQLIYNDLL